MNIDKENEKKATHNFQQDQNTKNQDVENNDPCSQSGTPSKKNETVKMKLKIEKTYKPENRFQYIKTPEYYVPIYANPREFHDISKRFACTSKSGLSNAKPDMPCTCENCALMGIVRDSQKIPFADELIWQNREQRKQERLGTEKTEHDSERKKRYAEDPCMHCHHYKHLLSRIIELEERLQLQQETTIPKAEFKKIITKLLENLKGYNNQESSQCRYVKEVKHSLEKPLISPPPLNTEEHPESSNNNTTDSCDNKTSPIITSTSNRFWRWGEEILKPGINIKNKIVLLVEDTLKMFPKGGSKPDEQTNSETNPPIIVESSACHSDTSVKISYINPNKWKESDLSLKPTVSDMNLSKTSTSLKDSYKQEFESKAHKYTEQYKQELWDAVQQNCSTSGHGMDHTITIVQSKGGDRIILQYNIDEFKILLFGKNAGTK